MPGVLSSFKISSLLRILIFLHIVYCRLGNSFRGFGDTTPFFIVCLPVVSYFPAVITSDPVREPGVLVSSCTQNPGYCQFRILVMIHFPECDVA